MKKLIAVVVDEEDILKLISVNIAKAGFVVKEFTHGKPFLRFLSTNSPDVIILDLMLPDIDGFEICKQVRSGQKGAHIPIIMLTARGEEADRVLGLELGADDYVTKPFSPRELVARVKAILRRIDTPSDEKALTIGDKITLDAQKFEVTASGKAITLTPTEFKILEILASKKGWVFTRDQILDYLWGHEKIVLDRTIDVHIRNLREKLGPEVADLIKNIRGVGYKLES